LLVYLHGKWASPEDSCSFFESAAERVRALLVCPRGNAPASSGGDWSGTFESQRATVDGAIVESAALTSSGTFATTNGTLLGFSSGARLALQIALAEPGRWSGLVLMSMRLTIDAPKVAASGVRRVVLATAEDDGSGSSMRAAVAKLESVGVETRFVSLGRVGHHFATDMSTRMRDAVEWVRGPLP